MQVRDAVKRRVRFVCLCRRTLVGLFAALCGIAVPETAAFAQSDLPAVFVSNNGNLEGSVSAFTVNPNGTLSFVNRVVTGTRPNTSTPCAGCNGYEISITPNGRHLAVGHPAGDLDGVSIHRVAADASISFVLIVSLPVGVGAPLDLVWVDDEYLAVTRTDTNPDVIVIYRLDPNGPSLTEIGTTPAGGNSLGYLVKHPMRRTIYSNDSGSNVVRAFDVSTNGVLTLIDTESTGSTFPLELAISPDGRRLYAAGGISNGGNKVIGLNIAPDGTLSPMAGSPYVSPGASPSNVFVNDNSKIVVVGHGTDATARTFSIDPDTGALSSLGHMFDVGLQGTLGDVHVRRGLVFITDNSTAIDGITGIYSFTLGGDGSLTQNGAIQLTQGIAPRSVATWVPIPRKGDLNCDRAVDTGDIDAFILALLDADAYAAAYPDCDRALADVNNDGGINGDDAQALLDIVILPR